MSENNTDEGELFDTDSSEGVTDPANDTKEQETDSKSEQEQEALELEEPAKAKDEGKTSAEENRQKQVQATAAKILAGELSLDELPKDMHWMKKDLEPLVAEKVDVKAVIREEILAEQQKKDFEARKNALNGAGLTRDQKAALQAKYKELRQKNLPQLDALHLAEEIVGIDLENAALEAQRAKMRLPESSQPPVTGEFTMEQIAKLEDEHGYAGMKDRVPQNLIPEYNRWTAGQK